MRLAFWRTMLEAANAQSVEPLSNFVISKSEFSNFMSRGWRSISYASAPIFHGRRNTFEAWKHEIAKRSATESSALQPRYQLCMMSRKLVSISYGQLPRLLRISQDCFVFTSSTSHVVESLAKSCCFVINLHFGILNIPQHPSSGQLVSPVS